MSYGITSEPTEEGLEERPEAATAALGWTPRVLSLYIKKKVSDESSW